MPNRRLIRTIVITAVVLAAAVAARAGEVAGQRTTNARRVAGPAAPVEIGLALTFTGVPDVNQKPACEEMNLPCESPRTFGDAGLAFSGARYFGDHVGVVGEFGRWDNLWDSWKTAHENHREDNVVHDLMVGARLATAFHVDRGPRGPFDQRAFVQVLVGFEGGDVAPGGRAVRIGGGIDIRGRAGVMFRLGMDYDIVHTTGRSLTGGRLVLGVVFGAGGD